MVRPSKLQADKKLSNKTSIHHALHEDVDILSLRLAYQAVMVASQQQSSDPLYSAYQSAVSAFANTVMTEHHPLVSRQFNNKKSLLSAPSKRIRLPVSARSTKASGETTKPQELSGKNNSSEAKLLRLAQQLDLLNTRIEQINEHQLFTQSEAVEHQTKITQALNALARDVKQQPVNNQRSQPLAMQEKDDTRLETPQSYSDKECVPSRTGFTRKQYRYVAGRFKKKLSGTTTVKRKQSVSDKNRNTTASLQQEQVAPVLHSSEQLFESKLFQNSWQALKQLEKKDSEALKQSRATHSCLYVSHPDGLALRAEKRNQFSQLSGNQFKEDSESDNQVREFAESEPEAVELNNNQLEDSLNDLDFSGDDAFLAAGLKEPDSWFVKTLSQPRRIAAFTGVMLIFVVLYGATGYWMLSHPHSGGLSGMIQSFRQHLAEQADTLLVSERDTDGNILLASESSEPSWVKSDILQTTNVATGRPDPFAPLVTENQQVDFNKPKDLLEGLSFTGFIGHKQPNKQVAIMQIFDADTGSSSTIIKKTGESFKINGQVVYLKKISKTAIFLSVKGRTRVVPINPYQDNANVTASSTASGVGGSALQALQSQTAAQSVTAVNPELQEY